MPGLELDAAQAASVGTYRLQKYPRRWKYRAMNKVSLHAADCKSSGILTVNKKYHEFYSMQISCITCPVVHWFRISQNVFTAIKLNYQHKRMILKNKSLLNIK